jgi:trehalose 6-phosphate synthase
VLRLEPARRHEPGGARNTSPRATTSRACSCLSQFTGAARELAEALIVNPYDIEQCAAAMHVALTMSPEEQRTRMRSMRNLVQEFNVFRWAGRMLIDAARMRHRRACCRTRAPRGAGRQRRGVG